MNKWMNSYSPNISVQPFWARRECLVFVSLMYTEYNSQADSESGTGLRQCSSRKFAHNQNPITDELMMHHVLKLLMTKLM